MVETDHAGFLYPLSDALSAQYSVGLIGAVCRQKHMDSGMDHFFLVRRLIFKWHVEAFSVRKACLA